MIINNEFDVFIAFHDSSGTDGALEQAMQIHKYLSENGIKCFLFPENSSSSAYKANFVKIMQSRLLLLVCNDNLARKSNGEVDYKKNYHLYVELDSFLAMTQADEFGKSINDSAVLFFNSSAETRLRHSPEKIHPLFNNRDSFFIAHSDDDSEAYGRVLEWVEDRLENYEYSNTSNEVLAVLTDRDSDLINRKIEGVNFRQVFKKANQIKCVGISNWTFSEHDGCKKLINGLKNNTKFEMLFLDPDGEYAKIRAEEERKNTRGQICNSIGMIKTELSQRFKNAPEVFELVSTYTFDMIPRENLIFIYGEKEDFLLVQNYSHALPGSVSPCMVVRRKKGFESPLYDHYEMVYENVKNNQKTRRFDVMGAEYVEE